MQGKDDFQIISKKRAIQSKGPKKNVKNGTLKRTKRSREGESERQNLSGRCKSFVRASQAIIKLWEEHDQRNTRQVCKVSDSLEPLILSDAFEAFFLGREACLERCLRSPSDGLHLRAFSTTSLSVMAVLYELHLCAKYTSKGVL